MRPVNNGMDVIDSRAVMERIEELQEIIGAATEGDDVSEEGDELTALKALAEEGAHATSEWDDGADLIRDSYFIEYARDFADNIGAIDRTARWPLDHIDWDAAAADLQSDYSPVNFDGVTYWVRSS